MAWVHITGERCLLQSVKQRVCLPCSMTKLQIHKTASIVICFYDTGLKLQVKFEALMFGHAKEKDVSMAILATLQEEGYQLPLVQLISLGSDGPNVNKTIWNLINEHMKASGLHGIFSFIPCNLHIVHNPFRQGLNVFGEQAEQLVLDLFLFLNASPCRKDCFSKHSLGLVSWHVQSHWLTLIPTIKRVLGCCRELFPSRIAKNYGQKEERSITKEKRTVRGCK